jgi:hypothetical protein
VTARSDDPHCRHVEAFEAIAEMLSLGPVLYEAEVSGERLISLEAPSGTFPRKRKRTPKQNDHDQGHSSKPSNRHDPSLSAEQLALNAQQHVARS